MQSKRSRLYRIWNTLKKRRAFAGSSWEAFQYFFQDTAASYVYPSRLRKLQPHEPFSFSNFQWVKPVYPRKLSPQEIAFCLTSEWSQRRLATFLNVSQSTICRVLQKGFHDDEKA